MDDQEYRDGEEERASFRPPVQEPVNTGAAAHESGEQAVDGTASGINQDAPLFDSATPKPGFFSRLRSKNKDAKAPVEEDEDNE